MTRTLTFGALLAFMIMVSLAVTGVSWYGTPGETLNGGITWGDCGFEIWGADGPGHFCSAD